jgi:hypothetical protein
MMYRLIDRYFYGSTERRNNILKERMNNFNNNFNAQLLVNVIETDHEFSMPEGFKERYFNFLDEITREINRKNEVTDYGMSNASPTNYKSR